MSTYLYYRLPIVYNIDYTDYKTENVYTIRPKSIRCVPCQIVRCRCNLSPIIPILVYINNIIFFSVFYTNNFFHEMYLKPAQFNKHIFNSL